MKNEITFLGLICCSLFSAWKIQVIVFQILIISLNLNISNIRSCVRQCASTSAPCWWPTVANVSAWTLSTSVAGAVTAAPCRNTVQQAAGWTAQPHALGHRSWGWVHSPWWYSVQLPSSCWLDHCDHYLWLQILRVSKWWHSVILAAGLTTLTAVFGLVAFSHTGSWLDHTDRCLWLQSLRVSRWWRSVMLAAGLTALTIVFGCRAWGWVCSLWWCSIMLPTGSWLDCSSTCPGPHILKVSAFSWM